MLGLGPWLDLAVVTAVALLGAAVLAVVVALVLRAFARHRSWPQALASTARHPFRLLLVLIALWTAFGIAWPDPGTEGLVAHALVIATIAVSAWLIGALASFALGTAVSGQRVDVRDNLVARRRRTQLNLLRRLVIAVVAVLGAGAVLLTFPGVQALGASVLASAGVAGIVLGVAAQSTLANVFAGIQLAFSDALRVDDVVIVEDEWGRIEEITLTYVVVHLWDDRRLVLPSTYFATTPFQNWTRRSSELLGSVEFDLDWRVSPAAMRAELDRILERTDLWDGRTKVLQVTDAVGGVVRIRILVTAVDAPTLFDLRCFVREELVEWLHEQRAALPLQRVQLVDEPETPRAAPSDDRPGLFTGDVAAQVRAGQFTGSITMPEGER
ncbi:MAG TPA: mechanosensitive ion channel family protein [Rhodoglobus sp.]|nr:mechanosensitive ion channel family protein [Rhodoglobus sp.]